MQQTTTYKLKLIETDDPFSPDALNANARTLETELSRIDAALFAEQSARESADTAKAAQTDLAALTQTVAANKSAAETALAQRPRIAVGSYTGNDAAARKISLSFTPSMVLLSNINGLMGSISGFFHGGMALANHPLKAASYSVVEIVQGGFQVSYPGRTDASTNTSGTAYLYFAIG